MSENSGKTHPYHCAVCGGRLVDAALGILVCEDCEEGFIPTMSEDGKERSLHWHPREEPQLHSRRSEPRDEAVDTGYEKAPDFEISQLVLSRILGSRSCLSTFDPACRIGDAFGAYRLFDGVHELNIEEMKSPGPDWCVWIELYEPKPERCFMAKNDSLARAICVAMLKAKDAQDDE